MAQPESEAAGAYDVRGLLRADRQTPSSTRSTPATCSRCCSRCGRARQQSEPGCAVTSRTCSTLRRRSATLAKTRRIRRGGVGTSISCCRSARWAGTSPRSITSVRLSSSSSFVASASTTTGRSPFRPMRSNSAFSPRPAPTRRLVANGARSISTPSCGSSPERGRSRSKLSKCPSVTQRAPS